MSGASFLHDYERQGEPRAETQLRARPLRELLEDVERFVRRFVVFSNDHQVVAVVLWTAHTHALGAAEVTPYLAVTSPVKRSGKTRLLEVLELLVPGPLRASSVSEAALFRTVGEGTTVLLLDEADALFGAKTKLNHEDLRSLINSGYRRGAVVARCEMNGKTPIVKRFQAFCPKVLAAIGDLPDTIADRAVPIRLHRRAPGERVQRFRFREAADEASSIREALARWAETAVVKLREARPDIPEEVNDRAADGWEPLLAIADAGAGEWPSRAREAARALHKPEVDEESLGILLLAHSRDVLGDQDRVASIDLARELAEIEDAPWGDLRGRPLDTRGLARFLRPFGIRPKKLRTGDRPLQGYERGDFAIAWDRYLAQFPLEPESDRNTGTSQVEGPFPPEQPPALFRPNTARDQVCSGVPDKQPEPGGVAADTEPLAYAHRRLPELGGNYFRLARQMNGDGLRRPDGRPWTAAALEEMLGK